MGSISGGQTREDSRQRRPYTAKFPELTSSGLRFERIFFVRGEWVNPLTPAYYTVVQMTGRRRSSKKIKCTLQLFNINDRVGGDDFWVCRCGNHFGDDTVVTLKGETSTTLQYVRKTQLMMGRPFLVLERVSSWHGVGLASLTIKKDRDKYKWLPWTYNHVEQSNCGIVTHSSSRTLNTEWIMVLYCSTAGRVLLSWQDWNYHTVCFWRSRRAPNFARHIFQWVEPPDVTPAVVLDRVW